MPLPTSTSYPVGIYVGNPDNSSPALQAGFLSEFGNVQASLGTPAFLDTFVDYRQAIPDWVSNSGWAAQSTAEALGTDGPVPVIALPLASIQSGSPSPDQQFREFASGQHDQVLGDIVHAWASQGFTRLVFRPGWEMNLQGPTYAGDDAQGQADWVQAFRHVYGVLHQAAAAAGVSVDVVWNPGATNYSNAGATASLYPGDAYVDTVGADIYSDAYPFSDSPGAAPTYHDWDTGQEDTSTAQFLADPVNRAHYWSLPAATRWADDSSQGHSQGFDSLAAFAAAHGKPFAVPETGAGNYGSGAAVQDDAAFPQWLAQRLAAVQAAGTKVSFVDIWNSNGGGNYHFTDAADGKPLEAAAWAKYFGNTQTAAATPPATRTFGSGPDKLAVWVSQDGWHGNAQLTISIDGKQLDGIQTVTASHANQQAQEVDVLGSFGTARHVVTVNFTNDAYGGSAAADRNLYVTGATINAAAITGTAMSLLASGPQSFTFQASSPAAPPALPSMQVQAGDQRVSAGAAVAFTLPAGLFVDPSGGTVAYSAQAAGNQPLPSWLSFDAATGRFVGTMPTGKTALEVVVVARGAGGAAAESFHLYSTASVPVLAAQQGDIRVGAGAAFSAQVPAGAFADPAGGQVSYAVTGAGGAALPTWARFDAASGTLSGTAPAGTATNQTFVVTATSASGGAAAEAFHLYGSALSLAAQAGDQRLTAGQAFSFQIPPGSFQSGGPAIALSSRLDTIQALPSWLRFDAGSATFTGNAPAAPGVTGIRVDAADGYGGHVAEAFHLYVS